MIWAGIAIGAVIGGVGVLLYVLYLFGKGMNW